MLSVAWITLLSRDRWVDAGEVTVAEAACWPHLPGGLHAGGGARSGPQHRLPWGGLELSPAHPQRSLFLGEASASTMWDNNAWTFFYDNSTDGEPPFLTQDFIHAFQPDAKLIVMLRDPVER